MTGLILLFLLCAFRSGSDRYYLKKAAGFHSDGGDVFHYLRGKKALKLISFYLSLYSVKLLLALFSFLPFIVAFVVLRNITLGGSMSLAAFKIMLILCAVLFVHGAVFYFRFNSFLFPARYCFVTGNFKSIKNLIAFSYLCMKGNRKKVFKRKLSFIPWFFSCVFLLPAGFVRSYYNQSMADIAADLIEKHLQKA